MSNIKLIPDTPPSPSAVLFHTLKKKLPHRSFCLLLVVILLLAALASFDFSKKKLQLLQEGDIAPTDITADQNFVFEDIQATTERKDKAKQMQPLICDFNYKHIASLPDDLATLFQTISAAKTPEQQIELQTQLSLKLNASITPEALTSLANPATQEIILQKVLPLIQNAFAEGVLPDIRLALPYKGGIAVRNLSTGEETLYPNANSVFDMKSIESLIANAIKALPATLAEKHAISLLFPALVHPTLEPNYDATKAYGNMLLQSVKPVLIRVQAGERIIRQGETVNKKQAVTLVNIFAHQSKPFDTTFFIGVSLCGIIFSTALLCSPMGFSVPNFDKRDPILIASLLVAFSLIAKALSVHGTQLAQTLPSFPAESLAYAVPVAGGAAVAALTFTSRHCVITSLLLSFFCTVMARGSLGLFVFYLLSASWSIWLTSRTENRQDMVWSLVPLTLGLFIFWISASFLTSGSFLSYLTEAGAVAVGALISMLCIFALAPIVEMTFRYTTRFRLMELLNLEQPLLRDLMLNAPGTYHHSLIVANMAEAAAKVIGAQSLLCKVAALYHDAGKLTKPEYFIENQISSDNPHNKLAPSMSALILISHAKKSAELAAKHQLGTRITDIIKQHHGTSVIRYFYQKALQQNDTAPPKIEDFSYPGPKPQTREAALVMLADAVEASSRTLVNPSPMRLRQHIDTIIKGIYADGELDETDITFRDLNRVAESFHKVLRGIFHHRIAYPTKHSVATNGNGATTSAAS